MSSDIVDGGICSLIAGDARADVSVRNEAARNRNGIKEKRNVVAQSLRVVVMQSTNIANACLEFRKKR